jgi:hypothetical protein
MLHPLVGRGGDHDALADRDVVQGDHLGCRPAQPGARQVVAGEHRVRLGGAGREEDPLGAHLNELVLGGQGHARSFVEAERRVPVEDLHLGEHAHLGLEHADAIQGWPRREA